MRDINTFISKSLDQRIKNKSLRTLKTENSLIDFCSNDYLGFSRSEELKILFETELKKYPEYRMGSGGSRLLAGNHSFTENLEQGIALFHDAESALIYNSGFDANIGLLACLPQRGDTIISDEFIHASIIDGIRLSHASRYVFRHNDHSSLEQKLKQAKGRIFIVVESVYSMDGDEAPLKQIAKLAKQYSAALIVDEAHAVGIFGDSGKGLVYELGLCGEVFARIITFGKALGSHGAAILGSKQLRSYLINFSRAFIYTTAAPFLSHLAVKSAYLYLNSRDHQSEIHQRIKFFKQNAKTGINLLNSRSAIQIIVIPGNEKAREIARLIQVEGFDLRAILSPSVAEGSERLRICLHNHNSIEEIKSFCELLNKTL
ncbi:MAG: 8-amino-7-oxononanoate synthase [Daejeonella sp.]|uniref:aminotransferase class I/II-fold pyridoxal phosphate-dependent enzyme n=1 Tax=Daejeonella sp. TaxID=2805397 RepID=UPI0027354F4D|nr:8-amino-7-oxononanoate synthase [Daejeonella sp.]MDP3466762.1 8-amino-7-oxononanoate synthase [Daejeonella sp.]